MLSFVFFELTYFTQETWRAPELAKEINNPYASNKIVVEKGQALFSKLCWACLGKNRRGDEPAAGKLKPGSMDFVYAKLHIQIEGELFWRLLNGKGMMTPYKHSLSEENRWRPINHTRVLNVN